MPAGIVPFNAANPLCSASQCLQQVIGSLDNIPVAQYEACVAMFGSPSTLTITLPADVVFSTTTATVPYTDIIVTLTTTSSTQYETLTTYAEVVEIVTEYSSTSVAVVTEVVTASATSVAPIKKRSHRKRGCRRSSSSLSISSPSSSPATTSSALPNCANPEEYSSACSCIYAVSSTVTLTNSVPAATVTITESSAISSTSTSVVTVVVSSTIVVPATTTVTSTTTALYETTTTVTSTTTPVAPTQSSYLVIDNGPQHGKYLSVVSGYVQYTNAGVSAATRFNLLTAGGQPSLDSDPTAKLFLHQSSSAVGVLYFERDAAAAGFNDLAVTCTLVSGVVSCSTPSRGFDTLFSCGAYLYMAKSTWSQSGCTAVKFRMTT
ncbi:hypothetical protein C8A01DRAFT_48439 [Parachaetomium inaequale]|uniref:Uncharacterized protein n=1 Tax=Parachaetomium inaequale TaxID=2588326 RepID=A0AAN6PBK9_9PEZI|nr:hypothetical protein C8A01DRAFT_48439 [Parachaetomium inaequale]